MSRKSNVNKCKHELEIESEPLFSGKREKLTNQPTNQPGALINKISLRELYGGGC